MRKLLPLFFAVASIAFGYSCAKEGCTDPEALNYDAKAERDDEGCRYGDRFEDQKESLMRNHVALAYALYSDALFQATNLQTTITSFVSDPSDDGLSESKLAWRNAYYAYLQCEALRFSTGPVDDERELSRMLGTWPINPALIDYTNAATGGLISDSSSLPNVNSESLLMANESVNNKQTTIGFHAIEFLLWGMDDEDVFLLTSGNRTHLDYDEADTSVLNKDRRAAYLKGCSELLVTHLGLIRNDWDSLGSKNYRKDFLDLNVNIGLKNILTGIGTLTKSELADRALRKPVANGSQDFEISNFSDNSITDVIAMANSIEIFYRGTYTPLTSLDIKGKSIEDLITEANPDLANQVDKKLIECLEMVNGIPAPFDWQASQEAEFGAGPIANAATALNELEGLLKEVAREFDIGIETDLP